MKKEILISAVLALGLVSCGTDNAQTEVAQESTVIVTDDVKVATPHDLELNDGEKWIVDLGMMEGVRQIENLVANYASNDIAEYHALGDSIGIQTKKIISSCTMKGKGHDELHKWLLPFLDLKKALVVAETAEEGAALLAEARAELSIFNQYFK